MDQRPQTAALSHTGLTQGLIQQEGDVCHLRGARRPDQEIQTGDVLECRSLDVSLSALSKPGMLDGLSAGEHSMNTDANVGTTRLSTLGVVTLVTSILWWKGTGK